MRITPIIRYIYNAEGQKLATLAGGSFTYYRSVMVYGGVSGNSEQLLYMLQPEGTVVNENGRYAYKYHLTDYMGNVRAVSAFDKTSSEFVVEQMTDYYPFGLAHNYNNLHKNRYLFSGKELQDAAIGHSGFLGLYDFGARYYNPMLGRWFNPDPALQTTNPYLFCGNAPMVYVDKDGRWFWIVLSILAGAYMGGVQQSGSWNPADWDWSSGRLWGGMAVGGLAGVAGYGVGTAVSGAFATSGITGATFLQGGAVAGMTSGAAGGATAGMINGSGQAWIRGASFSEGLLNGMKQASVGTATGGVLGGTVSGVSSVLKGNNFWTGVPKIQPTPTATAKPATTGDPKTGNNHSVYEGVDEEGVVRYVGRTGREPQARFDEHARDIGSGKENLRYNVIEDGLTLPESRIIEQTNMNTFGGPQGGQLLNKINSVAPAKWDGMGIKIVPTPNGKLPIPQPVYHIQR